eukprot:scaffold7381_cov310-Pinguiococcus_pyrenoidosus.AAC.108
MSFRAKGTHRSCRARHHQYLMRQGCHGLLALRYPLDMRIQLVSQPALLHVVLVVVRLPMHAFKALLVGLDHGATRRRVHMLPYSHVLPHFARVRDPHVRTEEDKGVSVVGHVIRESREARLAGKGNARDAPQRENLPKVQAEQVVHVAGLVVDLVTTEGTSVQRVATSHAVLPFERLDCPSNDFASGQSAGEVPFQHGFHCGLQLLLAREDSTRSRHACELREQTQRDGLPIYQSRILAAAVRSAALPPSALVAAAAAHVHAHPKAGAKHEERQAQKDAHFDAWDASGAIWPRLWRQLRKSQDLEYVLCFDTVKLAHLYTHAHDQATLPPFVTAI